MDCNSVIAAKKQMTEWRGYKMEYKLNDFVELCNKCLEKIEYDKDDAARKLGKQIEYAENNVKFDFKKENENFYKSLINRGYNKSSNEYVFLQDKSVIAKVNPFKPFNKINGNDVLDQKWHVLISLLAFLDTASFDESAGISDIYNVGRIERIILDEKFHLKLMCDKKKQKLY